MRPVAGGRVVSALDCYVAGLSIESSFLPLLKNVCKEKQPATMLTIKKSAGVASEVNLRE